MSDRIERIYQAIDEMEQVHDKPKPERFGGGIWNFDEEIGIWKKQIMDGEKKRGIPPLTSLQWTLIDVYINLKRVKLKVKGGEKVGE